MSSEPAPDVRPATSLPSQAEAESVRERLEELLGDRSSRAIELVSGLVQRFPAKADRLLHEWAQALEDQEPETAARAVHTLKGSALNLGSLAFSRLCGQVEEATLAGTLAAERRARAQELDAGATRFAALLADAAVDCGLLV